MKLLDDKQLNQEATAAIIGQKVSNPTFGEGTWHNPDQDRDVPFDDLRWSRFNNFEPTRMFQTVSQDVFSFIKHLNSGKESAYSRFIESAKYITEHYRTELMKKDRARHFHTTMLNCFDTYPRMLRIGAMNLMLHGVDSPTVEFRDSLSTDNTDESRYTLILANPPFSGSLDNEAVAKSLLAIANTKQTELLFISLFLRSLQISGRCASIVPDGVLTGSSKAHIALRKKLVDENRLQAVIYMPSVFQPYSGVSTAILIFTKTGSGGTDNVWFYYMKADGYSLDQKRNEVAESDIPDIVARFHTLVGTHPGASASAEESRKRTEQSFLVPADEICDLLKFLVGKASKTFDVDVDDNITDGGIASGFVTTVMYRQKVLDFLSENRDLPVLNKIKNIEQLTASDIEELERIMWQELGSKEDYMRFLSRENLADSCADSVAAFIRTIIKVDRQKAVQLFTDYISENSLTAEQEEYLKSILDYVCENGDMETAALVNESPFDEINVLELFPGKFKQVADFVTNLHKSITAA